MRVIDVDDPRHHLRTTLLLTGEVPTPAAMAMLAALHRAADTL